MRIEPGEHALQGVLDEFAARHRLDIAPLDLRDHVPEEAEVGGITGRSGGAGSGAVAAVERYCHQ